VTGVIVLILAIIYGVMLTVGLVSCVADQASYYDDSGEYIEDYSDSDYSDEYYDDEEL
jgi:hypothetical protein